jgi:thiosulfate reductase/polysulfide reductase chain A
MEGLEHSPNCIEAIHCRYILPAITGNFNIKGGEKLRAVKSKLRMEYEISLHDMVTPEQKAKQIGSDRFKLEAFPGYDLCMTYSKAKVARDHVCFAHAGMCYEAMITGQPYPIKAVITLSSNPLVTQANTKKVYKALKNLDLYVVMDYWMTPCAEIADYVLPSANWLEREDLFNVWDAFPNIDVGEIAMPPKVAGKHDRRTDYDLWRGLGLRLGQEEYWPWQNLGEALNWRLEPLGLTISDIITKYGSYKPSQEEYGGLEFGTPTGKFELYSTVFEKLGYDPLPRFYETVESPVSNPELAKEYPFILITGGRHLPFFHSEHRQVDSLRREHPDPIVQINPGTAAELGIENDDWIWIESPRGRVRQKCRYFDGIVPDVVHAQHGWWFPELPGEEPWLHGVWESNINVLTCDDADYCNPINGGWPLRTLMCKIYKCQVYEESKKQPER